MNTLSEMESELILQSVGQTVKMCDCLSLRSGFDSRTDCLLISCVRAFKMSLIVLKIYDSKI